MRHVVVIACDPGSKKLAVTVTVNGREPEVYKRPIPTAKKDVPRQLFLARKWFRHIVLQYQPELNDVYVFIENPFFSPKTARAAGPLFKVNGVLQEAAYSCGVHTVQGVDIQRWKKVVVGNGSASKPQVMSWVRECWPAVYELIDKDQDLADSACINRYGQKVVATIDKMAQQRKLDDGSA